MNTSGNWGLEIEDMPQYKTNLSIDRDRIIVTDKKSTKIYKRKHFCIEERDDMTSSIKLYHGNTAKVVEINLDSKQQLDIVFSQLMK